MNKTIRILAIALAVQTVAAGYTLMGHSTLEAKPATGDLLSFDSSQVDHLVLNDAENDSVEIVKQDGKWLLPAADNFPADQGKVSEVLGKLHALKRGLPVATSGSDFSRFKVDDKDFERHLLLKKGDEAVADLYLGNGAGVNQSFARLDKDKIVYNAAIGTYDLPAKADNWEDKTILNLDGKDVSAISINDGPKLTRTAAADKTDVWQASSLSAGKQVNQTDAGQLLSRLTSLSFDKVLGKEAKPEYGLDKPALTIGLTHGKETRTYQIGKFKDGDNYVLKVSDRPEYFQLAGFTGKLLLDGTGNDKLLENVVPTAEAVSQASTAEMQSAQAPAVTQPPPAVPLPPASPQ